MRPSATWPALTASAPERSSGGTGTSWVQLYPGAGAAHGQQAGQHVDRRLEVLRHHPRRAARRPARGPRPAARGAARWTTRAPREGGRCGRSARPSRPGPPSSRPRATRCPSSRRGRCGSGRRRAGRSGSPRAGPASRRSARRAARALRGRRAGTPAPRRRARWRAGCRRPRASPRAPRATAAGWAAGARRRTCPPRRPRTACRCPLWTSAVSAWRSVEREMPSWAHRSRSAGRRAPGSSSPSRIAVPSRSSVSSKAVCDRTGAKTGSGAGPITAPPWSAKVLAACLRGKPSP